MTDLISTDLDYNGERIVADLNRLLRLRTTPIGMKLFESIDEMTAIQRIRRPKDVHTTDQIVGQAARNGWTVGITAEDLVGAQCSTVIGLHPAQRGLAIGRSYERRVVWQPRRRGRSPKAMDVVDYGKYQAMAVSPLSSGRLNPPDICLIYATPAQMILFINGLQWTGYKKLDFGCVGESACADSWGRALATGEPSLSLPCYAERRYGGVMEDELLMAIPPHFLPKVIQGLEALASNGLRYPIPSYGINNDVRAGMGVSY